MSLPAFHKALKTDARLRLALMGPSGAGKTLTALHLAQDLDAGPIAFIDTERGSASKYADQFDFDVLEVVAIQVATDAIADLFGVLIHH